MTDCFDCTDDGGPVNLKVKDTFHLTILLVASFALLLNVWGMWFGLPLLLNPDEPIYVNRAFHFGTGDLNPHWFGNPGNNLMYMLFLEFIGYYGLGHFFHVFSNTDIFKNQFHTNPTVFYMLGRSIGILAGTLSVMAIGYLGKRLVNKKVGILSALFLAVNPLFVEHSKYIRVDILGVLFIILAIHQGLKFWDDKKLKNITISSIAIGMAAASKYPFATVGIVLLLITFFLWLESDDDLPVKYIKFSPWKLLLANCTVVLVTFSVVTPFFFLDFKTAYRNIIHEARSTHLGHESLPLLQNYLWYITIVLPKYCGLPILVGASIGLARSIIKIDIRSTLVLSFPVIIFLVIGAGRLRWDRWIIPIIPFVGLYAAIGFEFISKNYLSSNNGTEEKQKIKETWGRSIYQFILLILLALIVFYPLRKSIALDRKFSLPDTRQICKEWIIENVSVGKIAQEWYTFQPLPRKAYAIGKYQFEDLEIHQYFSLPHRTSERYSSIEEYRSEGFTHIIISSFLYDRYLNEPERYPKEVGFYNFLFEKTPLKKFNPVDQEISGPTIAIYTID